MKQLYYKALSLVMALGILTAGLTACGSPDSSTAPAPEPAEGSTAAADPASETSGGGGTLVLYVSTPEDFLKHIVAEYEAATGVKVELVEAGTGELQKRIEAEGDNPLGDIMLGGMVSSGYLPNAHLWEAYTSTEDTNLPTEYQNTSGVVTAFNMVPSVLMVNNDLAGDLNITGYEDLLNPALKGQIVMPDPTQTSSGWEHLVNMLYAMGGGDTDEGWAYVEALMDNMEGKLLSGSSAVHKGVADGEYAVGLVAEGMVDIYLLEGLDVEKVFMEEGVVVNVDGVAIIKDCKNMENAQKFIDFMVSKDFQSKMAQLEPPRRPIREDLDVTTSLTPTSEINQIFIDEDYVAENKEAMLERFKDIMTNYA